MKQELSLSELATELTLLAIGQHAVVKRISINEFTIRFQREMTAKERRQQEWDDWWLA